MSIIIATLLVLILVFLWLANAYFKLSDARDTAIRSYRNYLWADEHETNPNNVANARLYYNQAASNFNATLDKFPANIIGFVSTDRFPRLRLEKQLDAATTAQPIVQPTANQNDQDKAA